MFLFGWMKISHVLQMRTWGVKLRSFQTRYSFCVSKPKSSVLHRHDFFVPRHRDIARVFALGTCRHCWRSNMTSATTLWFNFKITHSVHKSRPQLIPSASFPWVQKQRSKAETCSAKSSGEGEEGSLFEDQSSSRGEHRNEYIGAFEVAWKSFS